MNAYQTVKSADNVELQMSVFQPSKSNKRIVLINSAMGVHQRFYRKYAAFLAEQGFHAVTYDYRGIGDSAPKNLRGYKAHLWEWGAKDLTAMLRWIEKNHPEKTILVVGHSVGGQILGLTEKHSSIRGFYGVSAQSAYEGWWSGAGRWRISTIWRIVPIVCAVMGYLPKQVLGGTEDVPAGVARQWAQGGRSPNYIVDVFKDSEHNHFGEVKMPMLLNSFEDDGYAPRPSVEALKDLYPSARAETRHITLQEAKLPKIGHFGFFRSTSKDTLWQRSVAWLRGI